VVGWRSPTEISTGKPPLRRAWHVITVEGLLVVVADHLPAPAGPDEAEETAPPNIREPAFWDARSVAQVPLLIADNQIDVEPFQA
jgi:hypothetical protein